MMARRLMIRVNRGKLTPEGAAEALWQSYAGNSSAAIRDGQELRRRFGSKLDTGTEAVLKMAEDLAQRGDRNDEDTATH